MVDAGFSVIVNPSAHSSFTYRVVLLGHCPMGDVNYPGCSPRFVYGNSISRMVLSKSQDNCSWLHLGALVSLALQRFSELRKVLLIIALYRRWVAIGVTFNGTV